MTSLTTKNGEDQPLSLGTCAQIACIWEVTARKPGNVHRQADFADTTYNDFLLSSVAIASVIDRAPGRRVGEIVLDGIRATQRVVRRNTNLGILLLLAPLAVVPRDSRLREGVQTVLDDLNVDDSYAVFEAIRLANPGGLGRVPSQDVGDVPTLPLNTIMNLASDHDLIARQYANGFREIFDDGMTSFQIGLNQTQNLEQAIIFCHLSLMARHPDTLIARKRGSVESIDAAQRARHVLDRDWPRSASGVHAFAELDAWLRAEGNSRNPGATADLVTACLFAALREGSITLPSDYPWFIESGHA